MSTSVISPWTFVSLVVLAVTLFYPAYDCIRRDADDFARGTEFSWRITLLLGFVTGTFPIIGTVYLWTVVRPARRRART